jgi:hypothetical protein
MILVDVNIFEDVIRKRGGWEGSLAVLNEVRSEGIKGFISALTIPILYFLRKLPDSEARAKVKQIIQSFEIVDLTSKIIADAMDDEKWSISRMQYNFIRLSQLMWKP